MGMRFWRKCRRVTSLFLAVSLIVAAMAAPIHASEADAGGSTGASSGGAAVTESVYGVPELDRTYVYDFAELKDEYPSSNPIETAWTTDGLIQFNGSGSMYHHGDKHGLAVKNGNSFDVKVAGNAYITFILCEYGSQGTIELSGGAVDSQVSAHSSVLKGSEEQRVRFAYSGDAATISFTINNSGESYIHGIEIESTSDDVELIGWASKNFSLGIGDTTLAIAGAATAADAATATISSGAVYYAASESALISLDLAGDSLDASDLTNNSADVVESLAVDPSTKDIIVTFKDQATYPYQYRIAVQDRSAFMTPTTTGIYSFDLAGEDLPQELGKTTPISDSYTTDNGLLTIAKGSGEKSPYWHDTSHGLALNDGNALDIQVAGNAEITFHVCLYSHESSLTVSGLASDGSGSFDTNVFKGVTDNDAMTYTYTGGAATLRFTLSTTGESYLHGLTVKNTGSLEASPVKHVQAAMPTEIDSLDTLTVTPSGHRLYIGHDDSSANISTMSHLGYYVFDARADAASIEADIQIQSVGSSSNQGIFFGMFDDADPISQIATVAVRGNSSIRNVYSKDSSPSSPSAGSMNIPYQAGDVIHIMNQKEAGGWYSEATLNKETSSALIEYAKIVPLSSEDANVKYGFAFANVNVLVRNLVFKDEEGNVLYDQNDAYEAIGTAPSLSSIEPPVLSPDRTQITLNWSGELPNAEDDGAYVVEMSTDGGDTYTVIADQVKERAYTVNVDGSGEYKFKVYGICGDEQSAAIESSSISVLEPLNDPSVAIESGDGILTLQWTAVEQATAYDIYRKSSEESDYTLLAEGLTEPTYSDSDVVNETPYYYYIVARSAGNSGNGSVPVLSVPTAGHEGEYAQGDEAAEIFITRKSFDTVFTGTATLQGVVDRAGTLSLMVNGSEQDNASLEAGGTFAFLTALEEGRNDVNLIFSDTNGKLTRKTFNFVYLTSYDIIVDDNYNGADGAESAMQPGVKQYSTVQAAVDSVPSDNAERVVILIKEGSYDEHLRVASPNISLIGEDQDRVNINFYDPLLSPEGGSTSDRNAVYIQASAANFSAENLTFENTYTYLGDGTKSNESADAIRVDADQSTFVHVKLKGYQDTLYASTNRQFYYKNYILGNVDFIYGAAQALFDDSDIVFRYHAAKNSGYVTAPRTDADKDYGYIFNNSRISAEEGASGSKYLLARPWGPDGAATFINTYMSGIINDQTPYADMSGNLAVNARFNEYYTYGDGFSIHSGRPQISQAQAEELLTPSSLGWDPYATIAARAQSDYVGDLVTITVEKYIDNAYVNDQADPSSTDDTGLGRYALEGFASARNVTGGGLLLETSDNYHKVATASEFLSALANAKATGKATVIELTDDIALGSLEIGDAMTAYSSVIVPANHQPLLHPTLLQTGISTLKIEGMSGLTIFSRNGAKITHTRIEINGSSNIILRNLVFDELWEWDESTGGDYDRNDWDYVTVQEGSTGVWIDHSTFYKAYDGIVDVKKAVSTATTDVTISWSRFLPESEGSFFDDMMDLLEANPEQYPYYNELLTEDGMTKAQVRSYAAAQKKSHLVGASDTEANQEHLRLTLANNYYKNSMDRMPRLRAGYGHVYNTIMDASELLALRASIANETAQQKIVSNGAISTVGASVLVENSDIRGITKALLSGNGSSPAGAIGAVDTLYTMNGAPAELTVTDESQANFVLDAAVFKEGLPYSYQLYNAAELEKLVLPYAGAGKLTMSSVQWEKTSYVDESDPTKPGGNGGNEDDDDDTSGEPSDGDSNGSGGSGNSGGSEGADGSGDSEGNQDSPPTLTQIKETFEKLTPADRKEVDEAIEEFLPYSWSSVKGLSIAQLRILTKGQFTDKELAVIAENPMEALKELGIDIAGQFGIMTLKPMKNPNFTDVPQENWASESIKAAAKLGLVNGMGDGSFAPNASLKTTDAFTFLDRVLMLHDNMASQTLPRSTVDRYVSDYPQWAYFSVASISSRLSENTLRIISGLGDEPFSRELLAQVIYEATGGALAAVREAPAFTDTADSAYREAIEYCARAGLFNGTTATTMSPRKSLTRAEMIAVIVRLNESLQK